MNARIAKQRLTDIVGSKSKAEKIHFCTGEILDDLMEHSNDERFTLRANYWNNYFIIAQQQLIHEGYIKRSDYE